GAVWTLLAECWLVVAQHRAWLGQLLVTLPARADILLGEGEQAPRLIRIGLRQHAVAGLGVFVLFQRNAWRFRIENEARLAVGHTPRVIAIQRPVTAQCRVLLLLQAIFHVIPVGNAVAVRNDE